MYKVYFQDGTFLECKNIRKSFWKTIEAPIKYLDFSIQDMTFRFEGFDEYNFFYVQYRPLNKTMVPIISLIIPMGKKDGKIYQLICDLLRRKIYRWVAKENQEYGNKMKIINGVFYGWDCFMPIIGWKKGIYGIPQIKRLS